jgi:DNA-directed RNA polymerase subunit RPC12/RpoP
VPHPITRGRSMPDTETKGLDADPQCVKCGSKMRFACTEPDKPGFVHHVYECIKCWSTQSFVTPL